MTTVERCPACGGPVEPCGHEQRRYTSDGPWIPVCHDGTTWLGTCSRVRAIDVLPELLSLWVGLGFHDLEWDRSYMEGQAEQKLGAVLAKLGLPDREAVEAAIREG